jgi:hypothetical protein
VYFDAWFPRHRNYHPSHPARRLRMVEELSEYRATMLVWAALGGGSLALPYLEQEAWQEIPARFRLYGFVNDSEFIAACKTRGIKVFGIVYDMQGWEFPVELSPDEDRVLALNELRGDGKQDWLGIREFSQNRYPRLWPPIETYFPGGLVNSDGEPVTDLLDEACSRDIHGEPMHADWVESPDLDHFAYQMDRNNPVWREYLKAILRIQIDAGVDGIVFDTPDLPLVSVWYGGCFCKDCVTGFRAFLRELPERPAEVKGTDLEGFHYGEWLLERGFDFKSSRETTPLFMEYLRFQRQAVARHFGELADYAREYGKNLGRRILVSGNFYDLFPHFYALEPKCDVLVTERKTRYRQAAWCRYAAGFGGDKPVVVIEDPYDSLIPPLVEKLARGGGRDLFRSSIYEPAALGVNMTVPYGAWLGSVVRDSFFAPPELVTEIQAFLADHDELFDTRTYSETAVVFSVGTMLNQPVVNRFPRAGTAGTGAMADFWTVCEGLSRAAQPYDVILFPEGDLRTDTVAVDDLLRYRRLILPECAFLTERQADVLAGYLRAGGRVLTDSAVGTNLPAAAREAVVGHSLATRMEIGERFDLSQLPDGPQVRLSGEHDIALTVRRLDRGAAIHLIRYAYDEQRDEVPLLSGLTMRVRLPRPFFGVTAISPDESLEASVRCRGTDHYMSLRNVPLYSILLLQ